MADKIKKLSQAIRLGSTFRPQCKYNLFVWDCTGKVTESCAFGAAIEAIFGAPKTPLEMFDRRHELSDRFPISPDLENEIIHQNNKLGYTREQIADGLEAQGY